MLRRTLTTAALCWSLCPAVSAQGWVAEIVSAAEILPDRAYSGSSHSSVEFQSRDGVRLILDVDPRLLELSNPHADDRFHPVEPAQVRVALDAVKPLGTFVVPRIYCLPGLPRLIQSSFSVGNEIFLAPGLGEISQQVIAYTVTHELGHVVQHSLVPGRRGRAWFQYLSLRELDPKQYREDSIHRDRPGEIFAEDFRALFGGTDATLSHTLENPDLVWPTEVEGLESYFLALPASASGRTIAAHAFNFPNPFNPATTIRAELADEMLVPGGRAIITIYDARGRQIHRLPEMAVAPTLTIDFRGRDDRGRRLASGRYLYEIRVGERRVTGAMTLIQ